MSKSKKKPIIIVGAAVAAIAIAASSVIYYTTSFSSMTMAMLKILEEDEPLEESPDDIIEEVSEEVDATEYVVGVNCYDEYHKMILETDIDKLPDDANYIDTKTTPMIMMYSNKDDEWLEVAKPFPLKAYLRLYALAAEICMREEINPKDSDVKINPMDLIGESFCESPLQNYGEDLKDTSLVWLSEIFLTTNKAGPVSPEALKLQPGTSDWGTPYDQIDDDLADTYKLSNCPSFFGQAMFYSYCWDSAWRDYAVYVYISTEENPTLDSNKRAVYGSRKEIYEGSGRYITGEFWNGDDSLELASYDELKSSIKEGVFEQGSEFGYLTRPASYFLSDSMYTHAIQIRSFLKNRAKGSPDMRRYSDNGPWSVKNLDIACGTLNDKQKEYLETIKKMYVLTRFTGDGWYDVSNPPIYSSDPSNLGDLTKVYLEFVKKEINPLVTEKLSNANDKDVKQKLLSQPNSICDVFVHGDSGKVDPNKKYKLQLENTVATTDKEIKKGAWGNHTMYGFDCINAGNIAFIPFQQQIQGAYKAAPKPKAEKKPEKNIKQASARVCWPLTSSSKTISKNGYFGERKFDFHPGIDIQAKKGEDVYAIASGKIVEIKSTLDSNNSQYIIIEHGADGSFSFCSMYSNINTTLAVGDEVQQRQKIGTVASYASEFGDSSINTAVPDSSKSYLHLSTFVYKNDFEYPTPGNNFQEWPQYDFKLIQGCFNPLFLNWYADKAGTIDVTVKSHENENLRSIYTSLISNGDVISFSSLGEQVAAWVFSLNYQNTDCSTKLAECIKEDPWDSIYAIANDTASFYFGHNYVETTDKNNNKIPDYNTVVKNVLSAAMETNSSTETVSAGATGILGIACVPPFPAEVNGVNYFTSTYMTQAYACPFENFYVLRGVKPNRYQAGAHSGLDFGLPMKTPLVAVADGYAQYVSTGQPDNMGSDATLAYGNRVELRIKVQGEGEIVVSYSHLCIESYTMSGFDKHPNGKQVKAGEIIGYSGNSGCSFGSHVHIEVILSESLVKAHSLKVETHPALKMDVRGKKVQMVIRDYDSSANKKVNPWLLYCTNPKYDFLHTDEGCCSYSAPHAVFTFDGIKMYPDNPAFISKYRNGGQ